MPPQSALSSTLVAVASVVRSLRTWVYEGKDLVEVTVTPSAAVAVGTNINKQAQETIAATMEEATVLVFIELSPYTVRINSYRMEEIKHPGAIGIYRRVGTGQFGLIRGRNT